MNKILASVAILTVCAVACPQAGFARGTGGARGGGGESRGHESGYSAGHEEVHGNGSYYGSGQGSYHGGEYNSKTEQAHGNGVYSSSGQGSYQGGEYNSKTEQAHGNGVYSSSSQGRANGATYTGSHQANYAGASDRGTTYGAAGYHAGGAEYGAAGYHAGYSATAVGMHTTGMHTALPTDGFAAAATTAGTRTVTSVNTSHVTAPVNGAYAAARGTAVNNSFHHPEMFGSDWYGAHPGAWQATAWPAGRSFSTASWTALGATLGLAAGVQPISYNYGTNITYQGNEVYNDGQPLATADEYYQQAASVAQAAPPVDANDPGWTPLGTFGLVRNDDTDPPYVMQLAIHTSGAVAGNYCDMLTDHNLPVHGSVDSATQKLAWTFGNNTKAVGEVGLYNLTTQSDAPALIHIGKDKTQQWLLVRLKEPAPADDQ